MNLVLSRKASLEPSVFTFDVFDTAICRLTHAPEHVHLVVGQKLRALGVTTLSNSAWMCARAEAEFRQRLTVSHKEIDIYDIYENLRQLLRLSAGDSQIALQLELNEESRLIRPIATIRQQVEDLCQSGISPLFISDTYLTSKQLQKLLIRAGYRPDIKVIVSCEQRKSKIQGNIYDYVARSSGLNSSSFYHLGDNALSDVTNARAYGWNAELFQESHWTTRERVLFASGSGDFLSSTIAGSARAARLGQLTPTKDGIVSAAASVIGPMFAAYVLWICIDVIARGGRRIHFLARDGQILAAMCRRFTGWLGVDIAASYTYASRQAFLLAAISTTEDRIVDDALKLAYYDGIILSEALQSLKYTDEDILSISRYSGVEFIRISSSLNEKEKVNLRNTLLRPNFLNPLRARAEAAHGATLAYLESEGMFSSGEAYIVDLGWRGNTQLRLEKLLGSRVKVVGYYMGMTNSVLGPESNRCLWTETVALKTGLLEIMASADHTSVKSFCLAADGKPVCSPPIEEDKRAIDWGAREQQRVALRFLDYVLEAVEPSYCEAQDLYQALKSAGLAAYDHFRLAPTSAEAEAYGGCHYQRDVNHLKWEELAQTVSSWEIITHLFDRKQRAKLSSWYMGSIGRSRDSILPTLINNFFDRSIELKARIKTRNRRRNAQKIFKKRLVI